jgi:hypothetical protein
MIPIVTLKELADFLLTLPDEESINMTSGDYNDTLGGCLMTKYGKAQGWKFQDCFINRGWYADQRINSLIAIMERNPFQLFESNRACENIEDTKKVKYWKSVLRPEYKA